MCLVPGPNKRAPPPTVVSGGSRITPRRGRQLPGRGGAPTYDFAKISQKLHEIERIWAPRGGGTSAASFP